MDNDLKEANEWAKNILKNEDSTNKQGDKRSWTTIFIFVLIVIIIILAVYYYWLYSGNGLVSPLDQINYPA